MSKDNSSITPIIRKAGKRSVTEALELLQGKKICRREKKEDENEKQSHKITYYCITSINNGRRKKRSPALSFSRSLVLSEMRSCLIQRNWIHLRELLLLLLDGSNEVQPMVWRYMLLILLHSPEYSNSINLHNFFEMCIGDQSNKDRNFLKRLFSLWTDDLDSL